METMVKTNNGFEIAETDLHLRGPGDLMGTQQSGALGLLIADLGKDAKLLHLAREEAQAILQGDPALAHPGNLPIQMQVAAMGKSSGNWSRIC